MKTKLTSIPLVALLVLAGCSNSSTTPPPEQTGGHGGSGTGGESHAGGTTGQGGTTSTGGTTSKGGSSGSGGTSASGGSGSGGTTSSGGKTGSGGAGSGGTTSTGGESHAGGVGAGGTTAKDGGPSSGGVPGSGGVSATGGTGANDGGVDSKTGTGGSGTGGGSAVTISASGYPAAGASGQAAPTGAGSKVTVLPWAGFKGAISLTHDDTNQTQIDNYSKLQALNDKGNNARFTFYLETGKTSEMGSSVWPQAVKDGHELGNHTKSHSSTPDTSDIQAAEDTIKSKFGVTAYSFAAPNGATAYVSTIPTMKVFLTNRTAGDSGGISFTDDPSSKQWQLPCIIPATGASSSAMASPLNAAVSAGKWEINLVHGFSGGNDGAYQPVDIAQYTAAVTAVKATGNAWIDTVGTVSAYWIAGYKFSKLAPTTSGTDKTWTWKTSDFSNPFPPGKYLRVTTDGGVLKQGSTTLVWDDHGYYEVSLDAGTLTLSAQ